jgi:hypothetical protein
MPALPNHAEKGFYRPCRLQTGKKFPIRKGSLEVTNGRDTFVREVKRLPDDPSQRSPRVLLTSHYWGGEVGMYSTDATFRTQSTRMARPRDAYRVGKYPERNACRVFHWPAPVTCSK